ncbi:MAG: serine/threonine-protein kinase [bacterium]|nr:serine/threonine-protein kinase [bacterium]
MPEFTIAGKTITLRPAYVIGSGCEADIYRESGAAYKIFKSPMHPDYALAPAEQDMAKRRIKEHQKKLPSFPQGLPARVITPEELVRDKGGQIAGYRMGLVEGAEVLLLYGDRDFRERGVPDERIRDIFLDLHKTVEGVHEKRVVFGDFNDLNVLVKGTEAHVIDADSMQFGPYLARMFTQTFVDPLLCEKTVSVRDPTKSELMLVRPYTVNADWYSYLVMLMRSLLFVGPYGGVYRPKNPQKRISHDLRPLKRITVFDSEVVYPKPARHFKTLPDDLLDYFDQVFRKDLRGTPPVSLIENLRFTMCNICGAVHARTVCPNCVGTTPIAVKEIHTGTVRGTKVFEGGAVLFAVMQKGALRYLYHHDGAFLREGRQKVVTGPLNPSIRYRINGSRTIFGRGGQGIVFGGPTQESISVDAYGLLPLIDANAEYIFYAESGALQRIGGLGVQYPERVGDVLANQTLFWTGDTLGFGFYRAAELSNFFVFRPAHKGINDSVQLPPIRGQLVDSTCCFADRRIWFFTATQEGGKTIHRCFLLDEHGVLLGQAEALAGDGSWLGHVRGACATHDFLLVSTDDGVVRVALEGGTLGVVKEYSDTHRFVDGASHLFLNHEGLYVVQRHDIWRLTIGSP